MFFGIEHGWLPILPLMLLGFVFWIALIAAVIWGLSHWLHVPGVPLTTYQPVNAPSALEILCQRYARGEIDTNTFEQMRERLEAAQRPVS